MQNISDLIQEAKPLYLARKKRNNCIKTSVALMFCICLVYLSFPQKQVADVSYWDLGYTETETASYIENLGLPVDDYGLLLVG